MDPKIIEWLTKSIPGIIVLGMLGSILAVLAIKLLHWTFKRIIVRSIAQFVKNIYRSYFVSKNLAIELTSEDDKAYLILFTLFKATKLILNLIIFLAALGFFVFWSVGESAVTLKSYIALVVTIAVGYYLARQIVAFIITEKYTLSKFVQQEENYFRSLMKEPNIVDDKEFLKIKDSLIDSLDKIGIKEYKDKSAAIVLLSIWINVYPDNNLEDSFFDSYMFKFIMHMAKKYPQEHQRLIRRMGKRFLVDKEQLIGVFKRACAVNSFTESKAILRKSGLI